MSEQRCLVAAIAGLPNTGKSTLLNCLANEKVAITTHKAQTTRVATRIIVNKENKQIVFVDTPGLFSPQQPLEKHIVKNAWSNIGIADKILLLFDVRKKITTSFIRNLTKIRALNSHIILVINKIDLVAKDLLVTLALELNKLHDFERTFMISGLKNRGVQDLVAYLMKVAPLATWLYKENTTSDVELEFWLAELTREQLYRNCHQEVPYCLQVKTEYIRQTETRVKIWQTIYTASLNHKKIILGKNNAKIKAICRTLEKEMSKLLAKKVVLSLLIKPYKTSFFV